MYNRRVLGDGPLAHLVERIHGMDEVAGSSPAWSTTRKTARCGMQRVRHGPQKYVALRGYVFFMQEKTLCTDAQSLMSRALQVTGRNYL
jgi:hypothetical protein